MQTYNINWLKKPDGADKERYIRPETLAVKRFPKFLCCGSQF